MLRRASALRVLCNRASAPRLVASRSTPLLSRSYADDAQAAAKEKAAKEGKLFFTLSCPHETFINGEPVDIVTVPASSGEMGVLAQHVPTISSLNPGLLTIKKTDETGSQKEIQYFVSGGFLTVFPDSSCNVNALEAFPLEQIDPEKARKGLEEYTKELASATDAEAKAVAQIGVDVHQAMCHALKI